MLRPTGVSILGVLAIIGGACLILLGLLFMLGGAFLAHRVQTYPLFFAGLAGVGGIFFIAMGALDVAIGIGLLLLANWARILTMVFAVIGLAVAAIGLVSRMALFPVFLIGRQVIACAIYGLIVWYLSQPQIKRAFGALPAAPMPPNVPPPSSPEASTLPPAR